MCTFCGVKCFFMFFNGLFLVSGVVLIIIGAVQYTTYLHIGLFAGTGLSSISIVLITVGVIIVLISILGLFAAFTNNFNMVACFLCVLIVVILLEVITGIAFYVLRSKIDTSMGKKAKEVITEYTDKKKYAINSIQEKLRCCGADGPTDWHSSVGWGNNAAVPTSCCIAKSEGCGQDETKINKEGCLSAIKHYLFKNMLWVGAVCIALGFAEVLGVLAGVCFCMDIKKKDYQSFS